MRISSALRPTRSLATSTPWWAAAWPTSRGPFAVRLGNQSQFALREPEAAKILCRMVPHGHGHHGHHGHAAQHDRAAHAAGQDAAAGHHHGSTHHEGSTHHHGSAHHHGGSHHQAGNTSNTHNRTEARA